MWEVLLFPLCPKRMRSDKNTVLLLNSFIEKKKYEENYLQHYENYFDRDCRILQEKPIYISYSKLK